MKAAVYDAGEGDALRVERVRGRDAWQACLARQPSATVFHHWDWLRIMATALRSRLLPLGFYRADELVGLAPLLVRQFGPYTNANWTPFPYLGPLVPRALLPAALQALDRYQRRNGIGLIQLGFAPQADVDVPVLKMHGYVVQMDSTMVVPLAGNDEAALLARMPAKRRSRLRRALRSGVVVQAATEQAIRGDLHELLREVFSRQGLPPPYPIEALRLAWERFHTDPEARLTMATYQGEIAAVSITIGDGIRAYNWLAAGRHRLRSLNALTLLYWEDIRWARERGYRCFDLVGNPNPGIADYKRQFGADELPYAVAVRVNSQLAALLRTAYGQMSRGVHRRFGMSPLPDSVDAESTEARA